MSVNNVNNMITHNFKQLASMKKVNNAADNAAGLAIIQKLNSQINGYDTGVDNTSTAQDMYKVAEGGLSSINDNLQRIRELSVQSMNFIYTDSDKQAIQDEIDGLKSAIQDAAKGTEFNTKKLLDGSMANGHVASNPSGGGMGIHMDSSTLESLGIADYDITKDFNLSDIDKALEMVNSSRASMGATSNRMDHVINYNNYASQNLSSSKSRIEDLDVGKAVSDMQKNKVLNEYKMFAQSAKLKQQNMNALLFQ